MTHQMYPEFEVLFDTFKRRHLIFIGSLKILSFLHFRDASLALKSGLVLTCRSRLSYVFFGSFSTLFVTRTNHLQWANTQKLHLSRRLATNNFYYKIVDFANFSRLASVHISPFFKTAFSLFFCVIVEWYMPNLKFCSKTQWSMT